MPTRTSTKRRGNPAWVKGHRGAGGNVFQKGNQAAKGHGNPANGYILSLRQAGATSLTPEVARAIVLQWAKDALHKDFDIRETARCSLIANVLGRPKFEIDATATIVTLSPEEIVKKIDAIMGL